MVKGYVAVAERSIALILALLLNEELENQTAALVLSSLRAMLSSGSIAWSSAARNRHRQDHVEE